MLKKHKYQRNKKGEIKCNKHNLDVWIYRRHKATGGKYPTLDTEIKLRWMMEEYWPFKEFDGCSGISDHGWDKNLFCLYHDVGYQYKIGYESNEKGEYSVVSITRRHSDHMLQKHMYEFGLKKWSYLRYYGLRLVGWYAWYSWYFKHWWRNRKNE